MCDTCMQSLGATAGGTWKRISVALEVTRESDGILSQFRTHLAPYARPQWDSSTRLGLKTFTDGMTNLVIGVFNQDSPEDGIVLLRIYGSGTEKFIDRDRELASMQLMNRAGYAPLVYCLFANGLCCGFVPGRCLTPQEMGDPQMMRRTAACLARVHSVDATGSSIDKKAVLWNMCDWVLRVPSSFSDANKDSRFKELFGSLDALKSERDRLRLALGTLQTPIVFCHNDTQARNLVYCSDQDSVSIIDYEYSGMNYAAFDLGNFFCEFSGAEELDFSRYPDEKVQKTFIRMYLKECAKLKGEDPSTVSDGLVHTWYNDVSVCALASHLVWSYWGLLQAAHSVLQIDFIRYSYIRFMEYQKRKEEVYSL